MPDTTQPPTPNPQTPIALAAITLLIPVLLPLLVVFTPQLYLETDPRLTGDFGAQVISFGPAGSMNLAAISIVIAALIMAVTVRASGRIRWWSCGLVALGIIPCLYHVPEHINSRLHSGAWIAAACLGLAAAHLAQFRHARRLMLAALIAVVVPFFLQAVWYVYVEHPETVRSFHANLADNLARRGLIEGSPQAAKYLTRLEGNDVIGAVGMSNVFGSIVAAIAVTALAALLLGFRSRLGVKRLIAVTLTLLMALWTLKLTQSKGATLALLMTIAFGAGAWLMPRLRLNPRKLLPRLCVLFVLCGSAAVIVRGAAGPPEDHTGERSLLFRYHYWQGAARMIADEPSRILLGVGQGTFKDEYEAVRNPISPEVVASTHNVFVDYTVMLGLGGVAWCLLLLGWSWQSGRTLAQGLTPPTDEPVLDAPRPPLIPIGLLAAVVFLTQYAVIFPGLYAETAILWLIAATGFVGLAVYGLYPLLTRLNTQITAAIALAAALILLHAQIEMTFFWDAAAAFVWVFVALASVGDAEPATPARKPLNYLPAAALLVLGIAFTVTVAVPTTTHQTHLRNATEMLSVNPNAALRELDTAATVMPNDPTTIQWRVSLRGEIASALLRLDRDAEASMMFDQAFAVLDEAERTGMPELWLARRHGNLATTAFRLTDDRDWLTQAEQHYARAAELSPNSLSDHLRLADTQWRLGQTDNAAATYARTLEINTNYYLDPDAQLPEDDRQRIELRIK